MKRLAPAGLAWLGPLAGLVALALLVPPAAAQSDMQAPSSLVAETDSCGVNLTWDAPTTDAASITGYRVLRGADSASLATLASDTGSTDTAYSDTTASPGTMYTYSVQALRGATVSAQSNTVDVSVPQHPSPTEVAVTAMPAVVASTTDDYFVLYATFPLDGEELEIAVAVVLGEAGTTTISENVEPLPPERYRIEKYQVADPADIDGDCLDDVTELQNPGTMNPVNGAAAIPLENGAIIVRDRATFDTLTLDRAPRPGKFLLIMKEEESPDFYFLNTNNFLHHALFLWGIGLQPQSYEPGEVLSGQHEQFPGGVYLIVAEPRYDFEFFDLQYSVIGANMPLLDKDLAFYVPDSIQVKLGSDFNLLDASRVPLVLEPAPEFAGLNPGIGYGRLQVLNPDDRPHPRDIVIYEAVPNELPRVAGVITTEPQTPLSHVNLRAIQGNIPNAVIRNVLDYPEVDALIGNFARYEVTGSSWEIRAATPEEVSAHYESLRPSSVQPPGRDLSVTTITPLGDIGFGDWKAFGVKAANVAVLGKLGFPVGTVPDGFAIPFYFYDEFMKAHGFYDHIKAMLADPNFQTDYQVQDDMLDDLRDDIKDAESPQWMKDALVQMHAAWPEDQSLRYRSSTNNEDLPGFNGAGLYDSYTQKPQETVDDGIDKSMKQVFASLWTFRAFTEREFYRIDHLSTAMGVLVHPNYQDELANGVAVTFDPTTDRYREYYVNTQMGEDLVTNPQEHSIPEELRLFEFGGYEYDSVANTDVFTGYQVIRTSNLVGQGELLMTPAQMDQLRQHLTVIRDHFKGLYNPGPQDPFAMEIEFKITSDNILAIKQARPWVFAGVTRKPPLPIIFIGGGGGGGPTGPTPSEVDFEWNVKRDIEALAVGHDNPTGLWSDGVTLWLAENGDGADDAVYAYDLETGERLEEREFELDERNRAPRGVWSDGVTVWVSDSGRDRLFAYDLATGARLEDGDLELAERNRDVRGIWSDGTTMWVLDGIKDSLFAYDLATGALLAEYTLATQNSDPRGIWSDGVTIWISDPGASPRRLFAYRVPTLPDTLPGDPLELERVREEEFEELSSASNNSPRGIWSDGDVMYVADASDGKVYTYNMPDAIDARLASLTLSGVDTGEFDPGRTEYEVMLDGEVAVATLEVQREQRRATIAIAPADADPEAEGHQVALEGVDEITVTVTSADGLRTKGYRVALQYPTVELALEAGFNAIEWTGGTVSIAEALAAIDREVTVVYGWDEAAGMWRAYFPGLDDVPGINTLDTFEQGRTYWVAVEQSARWTIEEPADNHQ